MKLKRTNFYFPIEMLERLKSAKAKTEIPVSEIIRRAVDRILTEMGE
jgi:predicted DNA-binding protein